MNELHSEEFLIELSTGVTVEADLWKPQAAEEGNKIAICLHPWSWLGGRKGDPVLMSLIEPLVHQKYHVLCYNSRGNGNSTGWSSFTGFSEVEDLKAVVSWLINQVGDVRSVVFLGYSHGSLIASLHPVLPAIRTSHILLSYPLGPRAWLTMFNSSSYNSALRNLVQHPDSNVLVIFGDQDEFTSIAKYRTWASELGGSNLEIREIPNASHFWHGRSGRELQGIVSRWLP
ncbi:hypothetical protein HYPSUDRAFT_143778 [Hypholoma sublateritium FD-334 SS-4]|uniref:Xaa-Pro dipeptidyl-peptidase-like domain-containing protein n=1 Tax=Hypholoma sublateritium (strain FD-334 SS-4) TaxID=945553 RepID=A0A0D2PH76_HYPSF|nr:hypothetical protein HYPSUDRAFT_143778 [Hypholoma sublateritium FD-334 SS-4]